MAVDVAEDVDESSPAHAQEENSSKPQVIANVTEDRVAW